MVEDWTGGSTVWLTPCSFPKELVKIRKKVVHPTLAYRVEHSTTNPRLRL